MWSNWFSGNASIGSRSVIAFIRCKNNHMGQLQWIWCLIPPSTRECECMNRLISVIPPWAIVIFLRLIPTSDFEITSTLTASTFLRVAPSSFHFTATFCMHSVPPSWSAKTWHSKAILLIYLMVAQQTNSLTSMWCPPVLINHGEIRNWFSLLAKLCERADFT